MVEFDQFSMLLYNILHLFLSNHNNYQLDEPILSQSGVFTEFMVTRYEIVKIPLILNVYISCPDHISEGKVDVR